MLGALQRRSGVDTHGVPPARYGGSGSGGSGSSGTAVRGHGAAPEADDDGYVSSMGRRGVVGDSERDLINRINNTVSPSRTVCAPVTIAGRHSFIFAAVQLAHRHVWDVKPLYSTTGSAALKLQQANHSGGLISLHSS